MNDNRAQGGETDDPADRESRPPTRAFWRPQDESHGDDRNRAEGDSNCRWEQVADSLAQHLAIVSVAYFCALRRSEEGASRYSEPEAIERLAATTRVVEESPALLAREQRILADFTDSLAELLRGETGKGPTTSSPGSPPTR